MNASDSNTWRWVSFAAFFALLALAAVRFAESPYDSNRVLAGRWLLTLNGSAKPLRYVEFSTRGDLTAYELDGVTLDMVPGYSERWTVKDSLIEAVSNFGGGAPSSDPTQYALTVFDESTLQLTLLGHSPPHVVTLSRVPAK